MEPAELDSSLNQESDLSVQTRIQGHEKALEANPNDVASRMANHQRFWTPASPGSMVLNSVSHSTNPEWMLTAPWVSPRCVTAEKPAVRIMWLNSSGGGKRRMLSTR